MDSDHDGLVDLEEFSRAVAGEDASYQGRKLAVIREALRKLATDRDSCVPSLEAAFTELDVNGDGQIDALELKNGWAKGWLASSCPPSPPPSFPPLFLPPPPLSPQTRDAWDSSQITRGDPCDRALRPRRRRPDLAGRVCVPLRGPGSRRLVQPRRLLTQNHREDSER